MVAPKNIKKLQDDSRDLIVRRTDTFTYVAESHSNPRANHTVTVSFDSAGRKVRTRCTCEWAMYKGIACKHVLAALEYMAGQKDRTLSFWRDEDKARRQKHKLFQLVGDEKRDRNHIWITSRNAS